MRIVWGQVEGSVMVGTQASIVDVVEAVELPLACETLGLFPKVAPLSCAV